MGKGTYLKEQFSLEHVCEGSQTSKQIEDSRNVESKPRKKPVKIIEQPEQEEAYQNEKPEEG